MIKIEVHSTRAVIRSQEPLTVGLRGAKVRFSYGQPWEGLTKTAVFRQGDKTVTVADVGEEAIIPWEVLTRPGVPVQIGIYGTDSTGAVAIPTVWAITEPVEPGADPEGDPSAEPDPGLWEQMLVKLDTMENQLKNAASVVTVTLHANKDGVYEPSMFSPDIYVGFSAGRMVCCKLESRILTLVYATTVKCIFAGIYEGKVCTVTITTKEVAVAATTLSSFLVTVHDNGDGTYRADKTYEELLEAFNDGKRLVCWYFPDDVYLDLAAYHGVFTFTTALDLCVYQISVYEQTDVVSFTKTDMASRNSVQVIQIDMDQNGEYYPNYSFKDITSFFDSRIPMVCYWPEKEIIASLAAFSYTNSFTFIAVQNGVEYEIMIADDSSVCFKETELAKVSDLLPGGGVTVTDDGNGNVTITTTATASDEQEG